MTVAVQHDVPGARFNQYDETIEAGEVLHGSPLPPRWIFHFVMKTDLGFGVVNIFESPEDYEKYFAERMDHLVQELNLPAPQILFMEIHDYLLGSRRVG